MRIISGKYGRRRFDVPTNITARPTTDMARENIFNVLNNLLDYSSTSALDLFAGTGAVTFELASRGCPSVVCVEKASVQYRFIQHVKTQLRAEEVHPMRGDVFRFINTCSQAFDFIFADPPYDLPQLGELPQLIMASRLVRPGTLIVVEHPREYAFDSLPHFSQHRAYGKVNFSLFTIPEAEAQPDSDDLP